METKRIKNDILLLADLRNKGWRIKKSYEDGSGYLLIRNCD